MEIKNLAHRVRELRISNALSQEELSRNSGLSLRTIQRVENGETSPSGETLKRISRALAVTLDELIDRNIEKEIPSVIFKAKYEYLHIRNNKLLFSKTSAANDLVGDYSRSVNNVFKSLMVFLVSIPLFSTLAIIFYNQGMIAMAIHAGAFSFGFLVFAFYTMLFTSGTSLIHSENIDSIKIQRKLFNAIVLINYTESGLQKDRVLILKKNQVDEAKNILLSEKLIEAHEINLMSNKIGFEPYFWATLILMPFCLLFVNKDHVTMAYANGVLVLFASGLLLMKVILKLIKPLFNKTISH